MQQGSILLNVLSTTFEDLTLVVPTFKVATLNKDSGAGEAGGQGGPWPPPIKFSMMVFFVNCNLFDYILLFKRSRRCYCRLLLSFL